MQSSLPLDQLASIDRNFALVSNNEERDEGRRSIPRVSPRGVARENSRIGGIRIGESGSVFFFFFSEKYRDTRR